jgi:hypothetical protein
MDASEQYVRERCFDVKAEKTKPRGMWITIRAKDHEPEYCEWEESTRKAWLAAYAFTIEREEQIRRVEEEISFLAAADFSDTHGEDTPASSAAYDRILAPEEAALAELKRGMK